MMNKIVLQTIFIILVLLAGFTLGLGYAEGGNVIGLLIPATVVTMTAVGFLNVSPPKEQSDGTIYDVEAARQAYSEGKIPLNEMERRVDIALDPQAKQLRERVEDVNGVGPEISAALSAEYNTTEELATATQSDLERIYGIGPNTAYAIKQRFDSAQSTESPDANDSALQEET
ncbi:hypothetical protein C448_09285 [Halococcus morrhuae DSM 1307]|uniref:DisA/LigA helix-hairpin-helix motif domain-containing protein n=1 Tax=Halococcus morrhuae DSM 1307 TaxID=931277 RepID=M0MGU9_HALMO|nr:helix-hairpin-helix domain-containing protein [Halococcus morrhuae]EMA43929.1 hypothetical protein C448_09285 [Halococcus morrhuae DSM 1307]